MKELKREELAGSVGHHVRVLKPDGSMPAGMIHAEQLIYEYDKRDDEGNVIGFERAIDGIDIDIPQGSFVAILGHNGSGKSTLAKHMNAILVPTGGTMWVDGRDTKDPAQLWDVRQTAGMVFQNPDNQIIGTVVEEDVGFGPENLGVPTDEIWQRVEESLKAVGMLERRKEIIGRYDAAFRPLGVETLNHYPSDRESSGHLYLTRIPGITADGSAIQ